MKLRFIIITLLVLAFHSSFAQKSDLKELVDVIRTNTINRLNANGYSLSEKAQVPLIFMDGQIVATTDSLSSYALSDVKTISIYINGDLKQSEVFKNSSHPDAKLSILYGDIVRSAGVIVIQRK